VQVRQRVIRLVITVALITLAGPLVLTGLNAWGPVVLIVPLTAYFYWTFIRRGRSSRSPRSHPAPRGRPAATSKARAASSTKARSAMATAGPDAGPVVVKSSRRGRGQAHKR
jgi:hypothetical protein